MKILKDISSKTTNSICNNDKYTGPNPTSHKICFSEFQTAVKLEWLSWQGGSDCSEALCKMSFGPRSRGQRSMMKSFSQTSLKSTSALGHSHNVRHRQPVHVNHMVGLYIVTYTVSQYIQIYPESVDFLMISLHDQCFIYVS